MSGIVMPQMKRGRGYSHWNPGNPKQKEIAAQLSVPRLLRDRRHANKVINCWANLPNAHNSNHQSRDGEWIDDIDIKPDGRKKEDLEIIEIHLMEVKF